MLEPEVSLRIAMKYIQDNLTSSDIAVSIDGAHIKTNNTIHFDLVDFMRKYGYVKHNGDYSRWQGEYHSLDCTQRIIVSSKPGVGDVTITLNDGRTLYIESKKFKSGSGGEYPAMREAIGQLMTNCPDRSDILPVVAVPYSAKSEELAQKWSHNKRILNAGIRFILVKDNGSIIFI